MVAAGGALGPLHRDSGAGLYKMVSEYLVGRLGEHGPFADGERDGIKGGAVTDVAISRSFWGTGTPRVPGPQGQG